MESDKENIGDHHHYTGNLVPWDNERATTSSKKGKEPVMERTFTVDELATKKKKELQELCKSVGKSVYKKGRTGTTLCKTNDELIASLTGGEVPKKKTAQDASQEKVDRIHCRLEELGVSDPNRIVNPCLKAGIFNGHYNIEGDDALDQTILESNCIWCNQEMTISLRHCLVRDNEMNCKVLIHRCIKIEIIIISILRAVEEIVLLCPMHAFNFFVLYAFCLICVITVPDSICRIGLREWF